MAKFERFKLDLENSAANNIFDFIRTIPENELRSWTSDQWKSSLSIIKAKTNLEPEKFLQCMELLRAVISKTEFPFHTALIILVFILKSIDSLLQCLKNTVQSGIQIGMKSLILLALQILGEIKVALVKSLTTKDYKLLEEVLEYLPKIAIQKPDFVEIKTVLNIWKSFSSVFTVYLKNPNLQYERILSDPVTHLIKEIGRNIEFVHITQALQKPIGLIEMHLRVTNFYLKLLSKMLPQYLTKIMEEKFNAAQEFAESYKKAKLLPKHLIGTKISMLLYEYVEKDFDILLSYAYHHPDIFKSINTFANETTDDLKMILFEGYLSAVISNNDGSFIALYEKDFIEIFESCFKDSNFYLGLNAPNPPDTLVIQFAALTMLDETPNLLKYLRENVLKDNFWLAYTSTDVLILIQSYQYTQMDRCVETAIKEFHFWRDCYSKFALFSNNIKQSHIVRLLRNCIQLNKSMQISQLLRNINLNVLRLENYRLFLATGLHRSLEMTDQKVDIELHLDQLLCQFARGNSTVEDYYKMIVYIQLLETYHVTLHKNTENSLAEVTQNILKNSGSEWKIFSLFISSSLKLITKFLENSPSENAEKLVDYLCTMGETVMLPGSLKLLKFYSKSSSPHLRDRVNVALKEGHIDFSVTSTPKSMSDAINQIDELHLNHNCFESISKEPQSKRKCVGFQ